MKSLMGACPKTIFFMGATLPTPALAGGNILAGMPPFIDSTWLMIYQTPILVFLAGAIIVLSFFYFRQQREHSQRERQLENLIYARTQELEQANADLKRLSITDPLTGVRNRRFVELSIAEEMARIRRMRANPADEWGNKHEEDTSGISFLMVDIDFFKRVNDRYGHTAGDTVLRQLSTLFTSMTRESDTTVRWGGEEFLIIARNPRIQDTAIMAERMRKRISSYPFVINDQQAIRVTCSLGFASWPFSRGNPDALGWENVVEIADRALYLAKEKGRNAWCGFLPNPESREAITLDIIKDTDSAIKKGIVLVQASSNTSAGEHPEAVIPAVDAIPS